MPSKPQHNEGTYGEAASLLLGFGGRALWVFWLL